MKRFASFKILLSIVLLLFFVQIAAADAPNWNLVGTYNWNFVCTSGCSGVWSHSMTITSQETDGVFSGTGHTLESPNLRWIASGTVSGSAFTLQIDYLDPPPGVSTYSAAFTGTILPDGKLSGSGVSTVNERGNLVTTSGAATPIGSNQPPVAKAGSDQTGTVGTLVTLDGTGSSDPDNNLPLTYVWTMSAPSGSTATLSSTTAANPTITPDKSGDYVISLTVTDSLGLPSTGADSVTITATNQPLVAAFKSYNLVESNAVEGPHMAGGKIIFVPEGSTGNIVKYDWNFGNKQKKTTTNPGDWVEMVYTDPEKYTVTLTVTDDKGAKATATEKLDLTLEPGDLILLRSGPPFSTIFTLIGNNYTHVGMYAGKIGGTHYMIESAIKPIGKSLIKKDGVQLTTFDRWSVNNKETYADAVRVNVNPEIKKRAVAWAMSKLGDKYDLNSITEDTKQIDSSSCIGLDKAKRSICLQEAKAYYCSELIWAAYYSASNGKIDLSKAYGKGAFPPDGLKASPYINFPPIQWHHEHYPG